MSPGRTHEILCQACGIPVKTLYTYPEDCCAETAVTTLPGGVMRVSCTRDRGNKKCLSGVHYDEFVKAGFEVTGRLRAESTGNTGRQ